MDRPEEQIADGKGDVEIATGHQSEIVMNPMVLP